MQLVRGNIILALTDCSILSCKLLDVLLETSLLFSLLVVFGMEQIGPSLSGEH